MSFQLRSNGGPGVQTDVVDPRSPAQPAALGVTWLLGEFQSGPDNVPAVLSSPADAKIVTGVPVDELEASMCLLDLYREAEPIVVASRITREGASGFWRLFGRDPDRSFRHIYGTNGPTEYIVDAGSTGRWSGCSLFWYVSFASGAALTAAATQSTLNLTGRTPMFTIYERTLTGASLYIAGDSGGPYTVQSYNVSTGKISISGEFSQAVIAGDGAITGLVYVVDNRANDQETTITIPYDVAGTSFSMSVARRYKKNSPLSVISSVPGLVMAKTDESSRVAESVLAEHPLCARWYTLQPPSISGAYNSDPLFPSNYAEVITALSGNTITLQWYRWSAASANGVYVDTFAPVDTALVQPVNYVVTYSSGTTASVVAEYRSGRTVSVGTLTHGTEFVPTNPFFCRFKLKATGTPASGDVVTIKARPLPAGLAARSGYLHPFAVTSDGAVTPRLRILSNTYNTITTVRTSRDLDDFNLSVMSAPEALGEVDATSVTWATSATLIFNADGIDKTFTAASNAVGIAAVVAALTALDTTNLFVFTSVNGALNVALRKSFGSKAALTVGNGTANSTFGFTNTDVFYGSSGGVARVEYAQPAMFALEPRPPIASGYVSHMQAPFADALAGKNYGMLQVAMPGITDPTAHAAFNEMLSARAWMGFGEIAWPYDSTEISDLSAAVVADVESGAAIESDHITWHVPPLAFLRDAAGTGTTRRSISGIMAGRRAKLATVGADGQRGFHLAAANNNEQGLIPAVKLFPFPETRHSAGIIDIKLLDEAGLVPVLQSNSSVYVYGNRLRSVSRDPNGERLDVTDRAVVFHVASALNASLRPYIFRSSTRAQLANIRSDVRAFMKPFWSNGWFSDANGDAFDDQVQIEVPDSVNTAYNLAVDKRLTVTVQFTPRGAIREVRVIMSSTDFAVQE